MSVEVIKSVMIIYIYIPIYIFHILAPFCCFTCLRGEHSVYYSYLCSLNKILDRVNDGVHVETGF